MKNKKILQVRYDRLFHDLFNENDMNLLEWAASQILECDIKEIKGKVNVLNIRLPRTNENERVKYVDLIVVYKNQKIIIELNNNYQGFYLRNVLYAINTLSNYYNLDKYNYYDKEHIYKVILVNLNWYKTESVSLKVPSKKIITYDYPMDDMLKKYYNADYLIKIININLDYFENLGYDSLENYDKLYKLLTVDTEDKLKNFSKYEELNFYSKRLYNLSNDNKYLEEIMTEEMERNLRGQENYLAGFTEGNVKGELKGKLEGRLEGKLETQTLIVKNLLNENMNDLQIMKITNLNKDELEKIKKELIN